MYQADILVSELLGSFGDNELSPECLAGAARLLRRTLHERTMLRAVVTVGRGGVCVPVCVYVCMCVCVPRAEGLCSQLCGGHFGSGRPIDPI
jgi:hypothetical protein